MKLQQKVPPAKGFRPAGVVEWVRYSPVPPPFIHKQRRYGKRAQGVRYEGKVQEHLLSLYPENYIPSPWFCFSELGVDRIRWCQPDGLLILPLSGLIILMECKLQHTSDAWWQLRWLYLPVIARAFPPNLWKYGFCEVVKWYDCAIPFPEAIKLKANVADVRAEEFGVHIWKP